MLKVGKDILVKPIHILFNKILSSGEYPKNWDTSIITPIFKGGHSSDINNFRGIAVSSCISKLFTKVLNNRICDFCNENSVFSTNQYGFMELMITFLY